MVLAQAFQGVLSRNQPIPDGVDGGRLALVQLKGNITYAELRAMGGAGAQAFNEEMVTAYGDMFYPTTKIAVTYPNGGTLPEMEESTDESRPLLIRSNIIGHMIDRKVYKYGIGAGERAIKAMDADYILATIKSGNQMARNLWEKKLLTRAMITTEFTLGSTGADVPFCNGSPNALKYAPPQWGGQVFQDTHNHYNAYNSSSVTYDVALNGTAATLSEHGVGGIYKCMVSENDVATIVNITNFQKIVRLAGGIVDRGGATTGNQYFEEGALGPTPKMGGRRIGSFQSNYGEIECWSTYRIPAGFGFMYVPGPQGDPQNALAVNYDPDYGLGVKLKEKPDWTSTFPLAEMHLEFEFGVSCGESRFSGACFQWAAGAVSYTNPVIN